MKNAMFVLFALIVLCGSVIVYAAANQFWSNEVTEMVTSYTVVLSSSNPTPVMGGSVEFAALLTGNGVPQASRTISFYKGEVLNGSSVTNASGIAVYPWTADGNCTWKALYTAP